MAETREEFAKRLKQQYPQYQDMTDDEFVTSFLAAHPQYEDHFAPATPQPADVQLQDPTLPSIDTNLPAFQQQSTQVQPSINDLGNLGRGAYLQSFGIEQPKEVQQGLESLVQSAALQAIPMEGMIRAGKGLLRLPAPSWYKGSPEYQSRFSQAPAYRAATEAEVMRPVAGELTGPAPAPAPVPTPAETIVAPVLSPAENKAILGIRANLTQTKAPVVQALASKSPEAAIRAALPVSQWNLVDEIVAEARATAPTIPLRAQPGVVEETRLAHVLNEAITPTPAPAEAPTPIVEPPAPVVRPAPEAPAAPVTGPRQDMVVANEPPVIEPELLPTNARPTNVGPQANQERGVAPYYISFAGTRVPVASMEEAAATFRQANGMLGAAAQHFGIQLPNQIGELHINVPVQNAMGEQVGFITPQGEAFRGTPANAERWTAEVRPVEPETLPAPQQQAPAPQQQQLPAPAPQPVAPMQPQEPQLQMGENTQRVLTGNPISTEDQQAVDSIIRAMQQQAGRDAIVAQQGTNPATVEALRTQALDNNLTFGTYRDMHGNPALVVARDENAAIRQVRNFGINPEDVTFAMRINRPGTQGEPIIATRATRVIDAPNTGQPALAEPDTPMHTPAAQLRRPRAVNVPVQQPTPIPAPAPTPRPQAPVQPAQPNPAAAQAAGEQVQEVALPDNVKRMMQAFRANARMSPEALLTQAKRAGYDITITPDRRITSIVRNNRAVAAAVAPVNAPKRELTQAEIDAMPDVTDPWINSALEAVRKPSVPEVIPVTQVMNIFQSGGATKEELQWAGVPKFLEGKTTVSKAELGNYLKEHSYRFDLKVYAEIIDPDNGEPPEFDAIPGPFTQPSTPIKYGEYNIPGGVNRQEIVFKFPTNMNPYLVKDYLGEQTTKLVNGQEVLAYKNIILLPENKRLYLQKRMDGSYVMVGKAHTGELTRVTPQVYSTLEKAERALLNEDMEVDHTGHTLKGRFQGHYTNGVFHMRTNDRIVDAMAIKYGDELQADLYQKAAALRRDLRNVLKQKGMSEAQIDEKLPRNYGFRTPQVLAETAALEQKLDDAMFNGLQMTPRERQDIIDMIKEYKRRYYYYVPMVENWNLLTIKHGVAQAIFEGKKGFAFSEAGNQVDRWGQSDKFTKITWEPGVLPPRPIHNVRRQPQATNIPRVALRFTLTPQRFGRWVNGIATGRYTEFFVNQRFGTNFSRAEFREMTANPQALANATEIVNRNIRGVPHPVNVPQQAPAQPTQHKLVKVYNGASTIATLEIDETGNIVWQPNYPAEFRDAHISDVIGPSASAIEGERGEALNNGVYGNQANVVRYNQSALNNANSFFNKKEFGEPKFVAHMMQHPYKEALIALEKGMDPKELYNLVDWSAWHKSFPVNMHGVQRHTPESRALSRLALAYRDERTEASKTAFKQALEQALASIPEQNKQPRAIWLMRFPQKLINVVKKSGLKYFVAAFAAGGAAKEVSSDK